MKNVALIFGVFLLSLSACKEAKNGEAKIVLHHSVEKMPLKLYERVHLSPVGHQYEVTKLWYYISTIKFVAEDGADQTFETKHLFKLEDEANTKQISIKDLKANTYKQIQIEFGINKANNTSEYLQQTNDNVAMEWPSTLGPGAYHYMKYEGKYDSLKTGVIKPFKMHSGPTYGADNSFVVNLDIPATTIDDNMVQINIGVDVQEWLQNPTNYDFSAFKKVMMNQNAQIIYKENGKSVFTLKNIE